MPPDQSNLNQGTNGPPVSEAVKRLTERKDQITLRAEIAAQEAKLAAVGLTADGPKGTTAISGDLSAEGLALAYLGVNSAASQIVRDIKGRCAGSPVFIHNPADFQAIAALRACRAQMKLLGTAMTDAVADGKRAVGPTEAHTPARSFAAGLEVPVIGAAVTSLMQVAALFRVDHDLKSTRVDISARAFILAVAGAMRKEGLDVYDTATMPLFSTDPSASSDLCKSMQALDEQHAEAVALIATMKGRMTKADPATQTEAQKQDREKLTAKRDKLAAVAARYEAFYAAMAKFDDATNSTKMMQHLDAERLSALVGPKTHFLWLQITGTSGTSKVTSSFFGSKIRYSGASVVC